MNNKKTCKIFLKAGIVVLICVVLASSSLSSGILVQKQDTVEKSRINTGENTAASSLSVSNKNKISTYDGILAPEAQKPQIEPVQSTQVKFISSDTSGIIIESYVNTIDLAVTKTMANSKTYDKISLPDYCSTNEVGNPALPELAKLVAIPESVDVHLDIVSSSYTDLPGYMVCPVPKQVPRDSPDGSMYYDEVFSLDKKTYSTNAFYPSEPVEIIGTSHIRDQKVVRLIFHTVQYNPVTKELRVFSLLQVEVSYSRAAVLEVKDVGPYDSICSDLMLNYDAAKASSPLGPKNLGTRQGSVTFPTVLDDPNNKADYLIITSNNFYPNPNDHNPLCDLANWRALYDGFDVAIVSVNRPIIGGNTDTNIKTFIEYVYNHWSAPHMSDNHVGYILLVGDTSNVVSHIAADDKWYVSIDDDYIPDIMIGRFSVDTYTELNTIASKTINYEKFYSDEQDWHKQVLLCEGTQYPIPGCDDDYDITEPDMCSLNDLKNIFIDNGGWEASEVFYRQYLNDFGYCSGQNPDAYMEATNAARTAIIDNINDGKSIVVYCGHGGTTSWQIFNSFDDDTDYTLLDNGEKLPLVFSLACDTGTFQDSSDCMGELLLNTPDKGAVAFFGAACGTGGRIIGSAPLLFSSIFEHFQYIVGKIITEVYIGAYCGCPEFNLLGDPALDLSGSIGHPEKPDLALSHSEITISSPLGAFEGRTITVTAQIHNLGQGVAENVLVRFIAVDEDDGEQHIIGDQTVQMIPGNSQIEVVQPWNLTPDEGNKAPIVQIDPLKSIDESYTLNNQAGIIIYPMSVEIHRPAEHADGTIQFTGTVHGGVPPYTWCWDFGDGTTETTADPSVLHVYHETGDYIATLTVIDVVGYTADDTMTYTLLPSVVYVDDDYTSSTPGWGYDHFNTISASINAVFYNGTVQVSKGVYYEHIAINKPVKLIGESKKNTIIDGSENGDVITISPANMTIQGFTIRNSGTSFRGVFIDGVSTGGSNVGNILITDNILTQNSNGIFVTGGSNVTIVGNTIRDNSVYGTQFIFTPSGIHRINHNNFVNNHPHVGIALGCQNFYFDNGYPSGGNYWCGYTSKYPNAVDDDHDGIWDTPYTVSMNKKDFYPLVHPFVLGDMNVDGVVDNFDINPFVLALTNPAEYQSQYHMLAVLHGDCNQDGIVSALDINPLVKLLTGT